MADASGYKNITPAGVSGFVKIIIISNRERIRFDFVSIVAEIGNNAAKIDLRYNSKPVADATGYKNITPAEVSVFLKVTFIFNRERIRFDFVSIVAEKWQQYRQNQLPYDLSGFVG